MIAAAIDRWLWRVPKEYPTHGQTRKVETSLGALRMRDSGGAGNTLVFFCDPPVPVEAYDEVIAAFQPHFRVLVVELPNFGFSTGGSLQSATFVGAVQSIEEAMLSLDLGPCVLFGPCICGFVAAELVKRGNLPARGLVLLQVPHAAGMHTWVSRVDPKGLLRIPLLGQLIVRMSARRIADSWVRFAAAPDSDAARISHSCVAALKSGGAYPLATMLQYWGKGTTDAQLDVPGIAFWGKQDRSHRGTVSAATRAHLPAAEIVEVADCGHFVELEQPAELAARVMPFLESCLQHPGA